MKNQLILFFLFIPGLLFSSTIPFRVVTGNTTIATADNDHVIVHTGAAATYTLGSVSDGFSVKIANHGTGSITFSAAITTASGQSITVLTNSSGLLEPGIVGNTITIARISGVWRSI